MMDGQKKQDQRSGLDQTDGRERLDRPGRLQRKALEKLLDSYEKSKTFQGGNQVRQSFSIQIGKLFPRYGDDAEYDYFCQVNEAMEELCDAALVTAEFEKKGVLKKVVLNQEKLEDCYAYLGRTPRRQEQETLIGIWEEIAEKLSEEQPGESAGQGGNSGDEPFGPLQRYIAAQRLRIEKNQNVEYFNQDLKEYRALLQAAAAVLWNREEIFIRNFSIQVFHDSKRMEQLSAKLSSLLYQYGEFQEKSTVLEECGIVHTPTYVMLKGNVKLTLRSQELNLSLLRGDIALSTESLKELRDITVPGARVVTVENLTSFHDYPAGEDCVIYLGGFHNQVKRDFLLFLHERNRGKEYRHFGDIDAGGFYILEHLKRKTGINFSPLYMDIETLQQHQEDRKPLTENDRKRLLQLKEEMEKRRRRNMDAENYAAVLDYMLEHNCKLEQEALHNGFFPYGNQF